jgi:small-conductance mechanosensitive channel
MDQIWTELVARLEPIILALPRAIVVVILVWLFYLVASRGLGLLDRTRKISPLVIVFLRRALRWLCLLVAVVLVLQAFQLLQNAWATLTAILAMVAIGFVAVWSVMSNAMCSLIILLSRPFQIGDEIEFPPDNLKGKVVNFSLLFTTLKTEEGKLLQIPNNLFFQRVVVRTHGKSQIELEDQLMAEKDAKV